MTFPIQQEMMLPNMLDKIKISVYSGQWNNSIRTSYKYWGWKKIVMWMHLENLECIKSTSTCPRKFFTFDGRKRAVFDPRQWPPYNWTTSAFLISCFIYIYTRFTAESSLYNNCKIYKIILKYKQTYFIYIYFTL